MSITRMFYKNIEYFRITRTWDYKNTEVQRYVRVGKAGTKFEKSLKEAKQIDQTLKRIQVNDRLIKVNNCEVYFHATGKIVGINRVFYPDYRRGTDIHMFTIRFNPKNINKKSKAKIRYTTVSIHLHGLEEAYKMAIDHLIRFSKIEDNKALIKLMHESFKYYQYDPTTIEAQKHVNIRGKFDPNESILDQRIAIEFSEASKKTGINIENTIEKNLLKELEQFQKDNPPPKNKRNQNISRW